MAVQVFGSVASGGEPETPEPEDKEDFDVEILKWVNVLRTKPTDFVALIQA